MFSRCNAYPHPCSNKTMLSGAKHTPIHCTSNTKINLTFQKFLAVCHLILFRNDSRRSWTSPNLRDHTCLTWMSIRHLSGSIFYILFFFNPHPPSIFFYLLFSSPHADISVRWIPLYIFLEAQILQRKPPKLFPMRFQF